MLCQKAGMLGRRRDSNPTQLATLSIPGSAKNALVRPCAQQNPPWIDGNRACQRAQRKRKSTGRGYKLPTASQ
jgi:hypothetical protein